MRFRKSILALGERFSDLYELRMYMRYMNVQKCEVTFLEDKSISLVVSYETLSRYLGLLY